MGLVAAASLSAGTLWLGAPAEAATVSGHTGWSNDGRTINVVEKIWYKSSYQGFNDFNLWSTASTDYYQGWYLKRGVWTHGTRGYVYKASGTTGYTVLLSSVLVGANMTVDSAYSFPNFVTMKY